MKWSFIPKGSTAPKYLVINADEGEPGTFKDRYLLERDPHALIEGMIIAARAIDSHVGFVYIRGEYVKPWQVFSGAVKEAYDAGLLGRNIQGSGFDFDIVVHRGRGRLHLRRGDGPALLARGQEGLAQDQAAVPRDQGRLRAAHHREQRGDHRGGAPHHQPGRGVVRRARHQDPGRDPALLGVGPRGEAGRGRGAGVGDPALAHLRPLRRHPRRAAAEGGGAGRLLGPDPHRRRDRREHGRRRPQGGRHHDRLRGRDRDGRDGLDPGGPAWWWRASTRTSRAGSARPAASPPAGSTR